AIVFAALLVVAGRLADRSGHKAGFQIGLAIFTLGSALCAISPGVGWLVASRVVQAIGAAVLMPTSLALLLATAPPERRSAVVRTLSVGALSLGLVKGNEWGWGSARTIGVLVAAAVLGVWFVARSARHPSPVVELPLLRIPAFATATVAAMLFMVAFAAMIL